MNFHTMIQSATQTLIDHVDELTALDQAIGDGDHGLNMRRGSLEIGRASCRERVCYAV